MSAATHSLRADGSEYNQGLFSIFLGVALQPAGIMFPNFSRLPSPGGCWLKEAITPLKSGNMSCDANSSGLLLRGPHVKTSRWKTEGQGPVAGLWLELRVMRQFQSLNRKASEPSTVMLTLSDT